MFENFTRSFQLVNESFEVLKKDKEIMLFPVISTIVTVLLLISFIVLIFFDNIGIINNPPATLNSFLTSFSVFSYILLFIWYILSYFIVIFFNTGLITCANIRLNGKDPTFWDGFNNAKKHVGKIFVWALISATIVLILRIIADRSNWLGKIVVDIFGVAWSLITFFVVPVMVFENISVFESIKKSGYLIKKTWGENVIGQFSMGLVFLILGFIGIFLLILAFTTGSFALIISVFTLIVIYWICLGIVNASLHGIFFAALYNYASTGKVSSAYGPGVMKNAFQPEGPFGISLGSTADIQKERVQLIVSLIIEYQNGGGASIDKVVSEAIKRGYDKEQVLSDIQHMKDRGVAYEPKTGEIRYEWD